MDYRGKPLSDYTTEQLTIILNSMYDQLAARHIASQHDKFVRNDGKAMPFPPPNHNFVNLKTEIEKELTNRNRDA
jgi:hypothetical protein